VPRESRCDAVLRMHGENGPRSALRRAISERFVLDSETPAYRDTIEFRGLP